MNPDDLRRKIEEIFESYENLTQTNDKQKLRASHIEAKFTVDVKQLENILEDYHQYKSLFAEPNRIKLEKISPVLVNVDQGKLWESLFKIVRGTWSMPLNKGYGRRLRYVVYDEFHDSVIGIIGLQSPPADLASRDTLFNYPENKKLDFVNQTMDIYSLGSIPPYSGLLGGKLVAGMAGSKTIVEDYRKKYLGKETLIAQKLLDNSLVALTTTSAYGRSSIYNRLKFNDKLIAEPIGYTKGYGNLHLESVYPDMVELLKENNLFHFGGYGNGPKQRWQNIARALQILNLPKKYSRHGVLREVFLFRLRSNLESGMSGGDFGTLIAHNEGEFSSYWLERWAIPRSKRAEDWKNISTEKYILQSLGRNPNSSQ